MATFPDATVAFTHRDPVAVIQSAITMMAYSDRLRRTSIDPRLAAGLLERPGAPAAQRMRARPRAGAGRTQHRHQLPPAQRQRNAAARRALPARRGRIDTEGAWSGSSITWTAIRAASTAVSATTCNGTSASRPTNCAGGSTSTSTGSTSAPNEGASMGSQEFEPVYRSRPGADALRPAAAEQAEQIAPGTVVLAGPVECLPADHR